ncbi:MAG: hypothetical protein P8Y70_12895 [Candidatus Lokiarchaeota archaeon]
MSYKFSKEELRKLLIDYNEIALKDYQLPKKVCIWDETLRDGEQSPTVYLTLDEKIHLAKMMDEIGVKIIAVGFPAVSRTIFKDWSTGTPELTTALRWIVFSPRRTVCPLPTTTVVERVPREELNQITSAIHYAKDNGFKINWVSEDGTRAELNHIKNVFKTAIKAGAERVVIGDTVGVLTPQSTSYLIKEIKRDVIDPLNKKVPMGIHTHNDFGLAVANTVTGVFEGCEYPHTCINGYGERAGNAALEEVATILERLGIDTGINLTKLPELSSVCEEYFCQPLSQYKPIVGDYAFSHESGLHIAAILAHPLTYEPINPKMVGRRRKFYLGKFSGSKSILNALKEKLQVLDLDIPDEIIKKIVTEVKRKHESSSKDEIRKSFHIIKDELQKITKGLSDKDFFEIANKYAQPYVPDDFKPKNKADQTEEKSN